MEKSRIMYNTKTNVETSNKNPNYLILYKNSILPFEQIKPALCFCRDNADEPCTLFEKQCKSWVEVADIVSWRARQ